MGFVSCEDEMFHYYGVFNLACTVTGLIIMVVPLHFLHRSIQGLPITILLSSTSKSMPQSLQLLSTSPQSPPLLSTFTSSPILEQIMYSIALSALFFFNLYEHATGYTGPPSIQTFGLVNNTMLSALLYKLSWSRKTSQQKKTVKNSKNTTEAEAESSHIVEAEVESFLNYRLSPQKVTMLGLFVSICLLTVGFVAGTQWEQFMTQILSGPIGIYVISTMGRLSWMHDGDSISTALKEPTASTVGGDQKSNNYRFTSFQLWQISCILLVLVVTCTEIESSLCNLNFLTSGNDHDQLQSFHQVLLSRSYHSIFLHIIIPALFYSVSECAFRLTGIDHTKKKQP